MKSNIVQRLAVLAISIALIISLSSAGSFNAFTGTVTATQVVETRSSDESFAGTGFTGTNLISTRFTTGTPDATAFQTTGSDTVPDFTRTFTGKQTTGEECIATKFFGVNSTTIAFFSPSTDAAGTTT